MQQVLRIMRFSFPPNWVCSILNASILIYLDLWDSDYKSFMKSTPIMKSLMKSTPIMKSVMESTLDMKLFMKSTLSMKSVMKSTPIMKPFMKSTLIMNLIMKSTPIMKSVMKSTPIMKPFMKSTLIMNLIMKSTPIMKSLMNSLWLWNDLALTNNHQSELKSLFHRFSVYLVGQVRKSDIVSWILREKSIKFVINVDT